MAYIGSGTGVVTLEVQNQPARNLQYTLRVGEMGTSLSLLFIPNPGHSSTPVVQVAIDDYQPGTNQYTSDQIGKGIAVLVCAAFDYPHGPEYFSGVGSSGKVELSWTISGNERIYTGYFWAYNMLGGGPPMSLKFAKFSFATSDTSSLATAV